MGNPVPQSLLDLGTTPLIWNFSKSFQTHIVERESWLTPAFGIYFFIPMGNFEAIMMAEWEKNTFGKCLFFFSLFWTVFPISFWLKQFEIHYMYSAWPPSVTTGVNFWTFICCSRVSQSSAFRWYLFPEKQKHWIAKHLCLVRNSCQRTSGNLQDWKGATDKATE